MGLPRHDGEHPFDPRGLFGYGRQVLFKKFSPRDLQLLIVGTFDVSLQGQPAPRAQAT